VSVQLDLLPERPPVLGRVEDVLLERFPADADLVGEPPDRDLVESVRTWGVLEPVLVRAAGGGVDYHDPANLVAGRRRIRAVRLLQREYRERVASLSRQTPPDGNPKDVPGYEQAYAQVVRFHRIPCRVVSDPEGTSGDGRTAVLGLASNALRRHNPASDYLQISALLGRFEGAGLSERRALTEVARATGMAVATIKQRLRLGALSAPLLDAFLAGRLGYSVALAAARLSPEAQALLTGVAGPVTLGVVRAARREAVTASQVRLFDDLTPGELRQMGDAYEALPLAVRAQEAVETLRSTRLPICAEAAEIIAELLAARDAAVDTLEERKANA
jgi:hypothetical protein